MEWSGSGWFIGMEYFDGMLVELNYDKEKMIVHSKMPKNILKDKAYSKFKIWYFNNKPFYRMQYVEKWCLVIKNGFF